MTFFVGLIWFVTATVVTVQSQEQVCSARDGVYALYKSCNIPCVTDDDCASDDGETCECDGQCGLSCIDQRKTTGCQLPPQPTPLNKGFTMLSPIPESLPVAFGYPATVSCLHGYSLLGPSSLTCMANGEWSSTDLYCLENTDEAASLTTCSSQDTNLVYHAQSNAYNKANFSVGDVVTYTCLPGYVSLGINNRTTCLSDGSWTQLWMKCILASCGNLGIPQHGIISSYDFRFGSTITYTCQEGYRLHGDNTRTCQVGNDGATVSWNNNMPTCQPMSCENLTITPPLQGSTSESLVGTVVNLHCNEGYRLVGEQSVVCLPNQNWNSNLPFCQAIMCTIPSSEGLMIKRADNLQTLYVGMQIRLNDRVKYECVDAAKMLVGEELRTCQEDSTLSGTEPTCHESCDELPKLANEHTYRVGSPETTLSTSHGSVVLYYCEEGGYILHGANRFECVDGEWQPQSTEVLLDDSNPYCTAVSQNKYFSYSIRTPRQYAINENGKYLLTTPVGSTVYIDCRRHKAASTWSPIWSFEPKKANEPTQVLNSRTPGVAMFELGSNNDRGWYRLLLLNVTKEDAGTYSCVNIGSGETSSSITVYIGNKECQDPGTPENGFRDPSEMPLSAPFIFTFSCAEGYQRVGCRKSRCSVAFDYQWDYALPKCVKIKETCQDEEFSGWNGENGYSIIQYVINDEKDEATQTFFCNVGYTLEPADATTATCRNESDPKWNLKGTDIACIEKEVQVQLKPSPVSNRKYTFYALTYQTITCSLQTTEDAYQITWKVTKNGELVEVSSNSSSRVSTVSNGTTATLYIDHAYVSDSGEYYCVYNKSQDHSLTESIFLEIEPICPDQREIQYFPNGNISPPPQGNFYLPQDTIVYSCNKSFILYGIPECLCLPNGTWKNFDLPVCIPEFSFWIRWGDRQITNQTTLQVTVGTGVVLDCETEGNITNVDPENKYGFGWFRINTEGVRHGSHFYQRVTGNSLRMFLSQIAMEQSGTYACGTYVNYTVVNLNVAVPCPKLDDPDHGRVRGWDWRTNTLVMYNCDDRYDITTGDTTRKCLQTGEWTGIEPVCSLARCRNLTTPTNGGFASSSVSFNLNQEVTFICDDDYEFVIGAKATLLCQADGSWNGAVPKCISKCLNVDCGPGARCITNDSTKKPECICKSVDVDCGNEILQGPVCGSNAETYPSQCHLEVDACVRFNGTYPTKVGDGPCLKRGLCSSRAVPSASARSCDRDNTYYYSPSLLKCTDTATDSCLEEGTGFPTREACESNCTRVNYCNIAETSGPCDQSVTRWAWDFSSSNSALRTCKQFTYGGCYGNENNFKTRDECLLTCPESCKTCPLTMSLFNACDYGPYAIRAKVLRLSRLEKTPQRTYPTTFHVNITGVFKTDSGQTTPGLQEEYNLKSSVLYRGIACPCPRFLTLDTQYLIITKLRSAFSDAYTREPIVDEGTVVQLWSDDLECELRCASSCTDLYASTGLPDCPHPNNAKCHCCQ